MAVFFLGGRRHGVAWKVEATCLVLARVTLPPPHEHALESSAVTCDRTRRRCRRASPTKPARPADMWRLPPHRPWFSLTPWHT